MMRVDDLFSIKGRGRVACMILDGDAPALGSKLRRMSDGSIYQILGVERWGMMASDKKGDAVGMLLCGGESLQVGDELERVE